MSTTTDLTTLKINYLTQAQYDAAVSGGTIEENELYLTPVSNTAITDVKVDGTSVVTSGVAAVDLTGKSDTGHTHTTSDITNFPTIPTITDTYSGSSSNGMSGKAVKSAIDALDGTITGSAGTGKTLSAFSQTDGKVSATFSNISITKSQISDFPIIPTITDTYSGTSSDGMSGKAVKSAIDALDGTITGSAGTGKTLSAFSQTDGKVSATFSDISITKSQVSDFPTIPSITLNGSSTTSPSFYAPTGAGTSGQYLKSNGSGAPSWTNFPTIPTITDTYSGTSSDGMSGKAVKSAIDALDGTITGSAGTSKTLSAFSQTDGKVSATFSDISITKSQVSDFPTNVSSFTNDSGYLTKYLTETVCFDNDKGIRGYTDANKTDSVIVAYYSQYGMVEIGSSNVPLRLRGSNTGDNTYILDSSGNFSVAGTIHGKLYSLYNIVTKDITISSAISAHSYQSAADYSFTVPDGYRAVGVVGYISDNYRIRATTYYIKDATAGTLNIGFCNTSTSSVSSCNISVKILCLHSTAYSSS